MELTRKVGSLEGAHRFDPGRNFGASVGRRAEVDMFSACEITST